MIITQLPRIAGKRGLETGLNLPEADVLSDGSASALERTVSTVSSDSVKGCPNSRNTNQANDQAKST